jgi:hypothetical protein
MPLDFSQPHLADLASWYGITPVPNDVLDRHKAVEVARRPGSWAYRHHLLANVLMPLGAMVSGVGIAFAMLSMVVAMALGHNNLVGLYFLFGFGCFMVCCWILSSGALSRGVKVFGPAEWYERDIHVRWMPHNGVPRSIANTAERIMADGHSDMRLVLGTLVQDYKVVDPYLVVRRGDEQIVLGIWDNNEIIEQASVRQV